MIQRNQGLGKLNVEKWLSRKKRKWFGGWDMAQVGGSGAEERKKSLWSCCRFHVMGRSLALSPHRKDG